MIGKEHPSRQLEAVHLFILAQGSRRRREKLSERCSRISTAELAGKAAACCSLRPRISARGMVLPYGLRGEVLRGRERTAEGPATPLCPLSALHGTRFAGLRPAWVVGPTSVRPGPALLEPTGTGRQPPERSAAHVAWASCPCPRHGQEGRVTGPRRRNVGVSLVDTQQHRWRQVQPPLPTRTPSQCPRHYPASSIDRFRGGRESLQAHRRAGQQGASRTMSRRAQILLDK